MAYPEILSVLGKGNNLHQVESVEGSNFLVTMPKKFRQTVWLKKGDCLVIDPIPEGKKVLGEIICVLPAKSVVELIKSGEWVPKIANFSDNPKEEEISPVTGAGGDASKATEEARINGLIQFYSSSCKPCPEPESCMPPSDSESESSDSNCSY